MLKRCEDGTVRRLLSGSGGQPKAAYIQNRWLQEEANMPGQSNCSHEIVRNRQQKILLNVAESAPNGLVDKPNGATGKTAHPTPKEH